MILYFILQKYARWLAFEFSNDLAVILLFHFHKGRLSIYLTRSNKSYEHTRQMKYSLNDTHD